MPPELRGHVGLAGVARAASPLIPQAWSAVAGRKRGRHRFGRAAEGRSESGVCPPPLPSALQDAGEWIGTGVGFDVSVRIRQLINWIVRIKTDCACLGRDKKPVIPAQWPSNKCVIRVGWRTGLRAGAEDEVCWISV